jgi:hypothetical protein
MKNLDACNAIAISMGRTNFRYIISGCLQNRDWVVEKYVENDLEARQVMSIYLLKL